ncbi:hypothetical protein DFH06DRAFT_1302968 [Mycena polygramma]|nr:hypothetical protein DFH06DRAFT_1302968 [Mycena polygramma]
MVFIQNAIRSPKGSQPPPLSSSNKENYAMPPCPDYTNLGQDFTNMGQRPSDAWLKNPSYIDGGVNPPAFYPSNDDIARKMYLWNPTHPMFHALPPNAPAPSAATDTPTIAVSADPAPLDEGTVAAPTPLELAGHQVSVIEVRPAPEKVPASRNAKPAAHKDERESKFDYIDLVNMTRCEFIMAFLKVHDRAEEYSGGVSHGPTFKFWWTGSPGGKAGAMTIDNDREWQIAVTALKAKRSAAVFVEYNLSSMEGYRIRKRSSSFSSSSSFPSLPSTPSPSPKKAFPHHEAQDDDPELMFGTKVPRVDDFTPQAQLNGQMVLKLKDKWSCAKHPGEHGDPGYCYIDNCGNHTGLNNRRFSIWASAIAAGECTLHEPPNTVEFDGLRDGRITAIRPRGRNGPRPAAPVAGPSTSSDATTLLLAAMLPLITNLQKPVASDQPPVTPPRRTTSVTTPPGTPRKSVPQMSPVAEPGAELHVCLADFLKHKQIDLLDIEPALAALDLTPDIISEVPMARLREVTGVVEGRLWKFKIFCRDWTERLEDKRAAMSFTDN